MGGCLSLCTLGGGQNPNMVTIWVMKEYKVHSSWTKFFVPPLDDFPYDSFAPMCFTKGVDLLGSSLCGRLVRFNGKGELSERRECRACNGICGILMHYNIYRESLLSLPGDFAKVEEEATENEKSIEDHVAREDEEAAVDEEK
ncbi:uncharacterized protein LOC130749383 [Lotus japonicus]|uniref:uncharacterized protein LOC130749383 n=1 Tax=Lotus japonicus TaxID=34305 RepID=UPI002588A17C|nr:uncharacterized protein LOC130749383 [Lotus japonicus]